MEVWEKVFLKSADFMEETHGQVGCVICHGGNSAVDDKDAAHIDIIRDPSPQSCMSCHEDIVEQNETSMHTTLEGMRYSLEQRGGDMTDCSVLDQAFDNHCAKCHTTCGQCHFSRPTNLEGGLISSHKVKAPPSMTNTCDACHGARAGAEYIGNNEGIDGDIHWNKYGMTCSKCHGDEMHGTPEEASNRYENEATTQCNDCHFDLTSNSDIEQHNVHLDDLACQVCHSLPYKNCYGCHVEMIEGQAHFSTEPSSIEFKIGYNPNISADDPYEYVVVRHVPVSVDTFASYGDNLLPEFDSLPTWKMATPHNIQLNTPQNASCNACHGNSELFLTSSDVAAGERNANKPVIVIKIPEARPEADSGTKE